MGKNDTIKQLTKLLTYAIVHKIGSTVNKEEIYADKYLKEYENFLKRSEEVSNNENWNAYDRSLIKKSLKNRVHDELLKRDFLDDRKFDIMEEEIDKALDSLDLR